jgi:hypothetical protein
MDVLEEVGDDVARRCYWDFGDWSDLWRETKHVPNAVTLQVSLLPVVSCFSLVHLSRKTCLLGVILHALLLVLG